MGEREKKWELWVARLLSTTNKTTVFYTSLAGLCDNGTKSSHRAVHALRSANPAQATGFGRGPLLSMPS